MTPVQKALEQMTRGMASQEGRAQVNSETMAERAAAAEARSERIAKIDNTQVSQMSDMDFAAAMQNGIYGRLD